ncbi:hypothetical protein SOVF_042460 [Spinacia oleracea]|nr:hypothetical protein SOVF_042460 [Spinacia oleracea]
MARLLRELIRKPSTSSRFIATLSHQNPTNLSPSLLFNQSILFGKTNFDNGGGLNPSSNQGLAEATHFSKSQIYPSFSLGYFLDPISPPGLVSEPEVEDRGMMWADSVKKKRKKKMNKHKYKKLRKRLRRKTKT